MVREVSQEGVCLFAVFICLDEGVRTLSYLAGWSWPTLLYELRGRKTTTVLAKAFSGSWCRVVSGQKGSGGLGSVLMFQKEDHEMKLRLQGSLLQGCCYTRNEKEGEVKQRARRCWSRQLTGPSTGRQHVPKEPCQDVLPKNHFLPLHSTKNSVEETLVVYEPSTLSIPIANASGFAVYLRKSVFEAQPTEVPMASRNPLLPTRALTEVPSSHYAIQLVSDKTLADRDSVSNDVSPRLCGPLRRPSGPTGRPFRDTPVCLSAFAAIDVLSVQQRSPTARASLRSKD